jgi:hypothetical protein
MAPGESSPHRTRYASGMRILPCLVLVAACSKTPTREVLIDRNWLDHMPAGEYEQMYVYRFVPSMGGGVFQDRTLFKGTFELFQFEATNDEIRFNLLHTNTKVTSHYTIEEVDGPKPFDIKLTIDRDPRGPRVYYGWRSENESDGTKLDQQLAAAATKHD